MVGPLVKNVYSFLETWIIRTCKIIPGIMAGQVVTGGQVGAGGHVVVDGEVVTGGQVGAGGHVVVVGEVVTGGQVGHDGHVVVDREVVTDG